VTCKPPYGPLTHAQRALCDSALLRAHRPEDAADVARNHDGAELLALLPRTTAIPGYLAGSLVTPEGAKRLIQLCRALSQAATDPRTIAELHALRALAYLACAMPGMAELHAEAALKLQPAHPAAQQLLKQLRGQHPNTAARLLNIAYQAYTPPLAGA
jgi:hypothetical protein